MYELFRPLISFPARDRKVQSFSRISSLVKYLLAFIPFITVNNNCKSNEHMNQKKVRC